MAVTPEYHYCDLDVLNNLGISSASRYKRFHDLGDLQRATRASEAALTQTPLDRLFRAVFKCEENLDRNKLDKAIQAGQEVLAYQVAGESRSAISQFLGYMLSTRSGMIGSVEDTIRTQTLSTEALEATLLDSPARGDRFTALSSMVTEFPIKMRASEILSAVLDIAKRFEDMELTVLSNDPNRTKRVKELDKIWYFSQVLHDRMIATPA